LTVAGLPSTRRCAGFSVRRKSSATRRAGRECPDQSQCRIEIGLQDSNSAFTPEDADQAVPQNGTPGNAYLKHRPAAMETAIRSDRLLRTRSAET